MRLVKLRFTKMHGCGNDYVYVNCFEQEVQDPVALSIAISDLSLIHIWNAKRQNRREIRCFTTMPPGSR